jgi:hypothetical protein
MHNAGNIDLTIKRWMYRRTKFILPPFGAATIEMADKIAS